MTLYKKRAPQFKAFQWNGPETELPEWLPYSKVEGAAGWESLEIKVGTDRYDYGVYESCNEGQFVVLNINKNKIKIMSEDTFNDFYEPIS